jgi:hypothetical protein
VINRCIVNVDTVWETLLKSNYEERNGYIGQYYKWETRIENDEHRKVFWFAAKTGREKKRRLKAMYSVREANAEQVSSFDVSTMVEAMTRFERGDIITCLCWEELKTKAKGCLREQKLFFGGTLFRNGSMEKSRCNACITSYGLIRATQRIYTGEEILVDYDPVIVHPVCYLDCYVVKANTISGGSFFSDYGLVKRLDTASNGSSRIYVIKYNDGKLERLNQMELKERMCLKPQENKLDLRKRQLHDGALEVLVAAACKRQR